MVRFRTAAILHDVSRDRMLIAALLVLVALPYLPGLSNGFVWLDHREIVAGELIVSSWSQVPGLFVEDKGFFAGYHRPLYSLMHSLDRAMWGLQPFGFHLSSLVLHLCNVVLVVFLARAAGLGRGATYVLGGLWGLHPINTATVGLIHAKADLLSVTTLGAAVLLLQRGVRSKLDLGLCIGSIAAFVAALLTKELAFVLPPGLVLAWLLGLRPPRKNAWAFWTVTATIGALAAAALFQRLSAGNPYVSSVPLGERLLTFATVFVDAVQRTLVPLELTIGDTVTRFGALERATQVRGLTTFALLVVLQLAALKKLPWSRPWILLLNLAFLPVAQIVPILHFKADRFLYLPTLAVLGFGVAAAERLIAKTPKAARMSPGRSSIASAVLAALLAVGYGLRSAQRVREFERDEALFAAELARTPDYVEGQTALAHAFDRSGRHAEATPLWERALVRNEARITYRNPDVIVVNLSHNLIARGRYEDAVRVLREHGNEVLEPASRDLVAFNLALATYRLERYAEALPLLRAYAERHPRDARSRLLLGASAIGVGDEDTARAALEAFLVLAPAGDPDRITAREWLRNL